MTQPNPNRQPNEQLITALSPLLAPLGYRIIHLEIQTHRQPVLRIYIDHLSISDQGINAQETKQPAIGIQDCVKATHAINEKLDLMPELEALLPGSYELEVSSPGVDRPLRGRQDYLNFIGHRIRLNLYRPLTEEESGNPAYVKKNPKQKNFLGTLAGLEGDKAVLTLPVPPTNSAEGSPVLIPLPLISKANLEPDFNFEGCVKESNHDEFI